MKTAGVDEYAFEANQLAADEHLDHCIEHLCWRGLARRVEVEAEKGCIIVVAMHE